MKILRGRSISKSARGLVKAAAAAVLVAGALPRALASQEFDLSRKITQYRVRVWSDEEGLPQNSVPAVLRLRDGTML
ncbi:MAG TPA: hypothetical protein VFS56_02275, partial [Gemmatimonadaceae bacterium]|nr:hypothetical protein [Gemmatimonadaceae bacterium]